MGAGALINALAFSGRNYLFGHIDQNQAAKERQRHDKAVEQVQKAQALWSKERTEKLDFYNKFLQECIVVEDKSIQCNSNLNRDPSKMNVPINSL